MSVKQVYKEMSKRLQYEKTPPTINEFLSNPYYLGEETQEGTKVFKYWKDKLNEWYPTPFFEYDPNLKIVLMSGGTGIGKCLGKDQELEILMSDEDIKKYNLEEYL